MERRTSKMARRALLVTSLILAGVVGASAAEGGLEAIPSKVAIAGHPLHPMFVVFPLGLFVATLIFDAMGLWKKDPFWPRAALATIVVGLIGGAVAAVFGFADYLFSIPGSAEVREDALIHGILNAVVMVLFLVNLWLRLRTRPDYAKPARVGTVLSAIGVIIMLVSAAIGGEMVYVDGVGIDLEREEESLAPQNIHTAPATFSLPNENGEGIEYSLAFPISASRC
jgi:uncharacterized membrane protein